MLRNATQVVRAGAVTIPMDSATLSFARAKADPAVAWKVELNPIVPADPGLEGVILTAHTLVGMTIISVEVAEDAIGGEQVIADMLGKALALELDRVALVGSGTPPEPKGVLGAQDVQTTAHDKPFADYGALSDAIAKLWTANSELNGIIWHPNVQAAAEKLVATCSGSTADGAADGRRVAEVSDQSDPIDWQRDAQGRECDLRRRLARVDDRNADRGQGRSVAPRAWSV